MNNTDPWRAIVTHLREPAPPPQRMRDRRTRHVLADVSPICRIEWSTQSTILVSWSDATAGRREDQAWRACIARGAGVCKLTGAAVRRGDLIFRPIRRGHGMPATAPDMILAESAPRGVSSIVAVKATP
ncbi:DUF3331 domain-containing protein [Caballeronia insecticola]|nr:DUF3331 domain-containing protein [Caballeronia insecticola]